MSEKELVNTFNENLTNLCKIISKIDPNSIIGTNINAITNSINQDNKTYILEFSNKVLIAENGVYATELKKGNDNFFINMDEKVYTKETTIDISSILNLKKLWIKMDKNDKNKRIIKKLLKNMVIIAENYLLL